jgi:hypothetical protein
MNSFKSNVEVRNYVEVWRTNTRSGVGMRCTGLLVWIEDIFADLVDESAAGVIYTNNYSIALKLFKMDIARTY